MRNKLLSIVLFGLIIDGSIVAAAQTDKPQEVPGHLLLSYYNNIGGNDLASLIKQPDFPSKPSERLLIDAFEIPKNIGENYGTVVQGYILPPATGEYTFWIYSDDQSELLLSPTTDPRQAIKIAQANGATGINNWERSPEQKSAPIRLEVGKKYYIEARHKEGGGEDYMAVGWQLPDKTIERPIPSKRFTTTPTDLRIEPPKPPRIVTWDEKDGPLPDTPGSHHLKFKATVKGKPFMLPFVLFLPDDYQTADKRWPVLVFLHGAGESGIDLQKIYVHGPNPRLRSDENFRKAFPAICLSPQHPGRWEDMQITRLVPELIRTIQSKFKVDKSRCAATGLSMGGLATWLVALEAPELFSALAPISSKSYHPETAAPLLKSIHTWIICGGNDGHFTLGSREMLSALQKVEAPVKLDEVPGAGHGIWANYYNDLNFYKWLADQTRVNPSSSKADRHDDDTRFSPDKSSSLPEVKAGFEVPNKIEPKLPHLEKHGSLRDNNRPIFTDYGPYGHTGSFNIALCISSGFVLTIAGIYLLRLS